MKILAVLFVAFAGGILSVFFADEDSLKNFLQNQILQISGLLLGLNVPSVIFLVGRLMDIPSDFSRSIKEIKDNICFMFLIFIGIFLILLLQPFSLLPDFGKCKITPDFLSRAAVISLFYLQVYALFEIVNGMFFLAANYKPQEEEISEEK